MKHRFHLSLLLVIVLLGAFLRLCMLDRVPPGFNQDEASIGYNAYSILKTGKDEYGKVMPIYFKAFGDQKLPVYIYATAASEAVLGVNEFAVRFPSAFFGILCLPLLYLLVEKLSKNSNLALLTTLVVALNPWSLHYNRSAYEVSISLFLFLAGTLGLYFGFAKKVRGAFLVGTLCFILSLYSYNLTRLLSPLLFLFIYIWLDKRYNGVARSEIIATGVASALLLFPFAALFFTSAGVDSAGGTLIFSSARFQAPLIEFRSFLVDIPVIINKALFNTQLLVFWEYLKHIASYLSVSFYFLSGEDHGNHGIGNVGQFYLFELPFVLLGIWTVIKNKDKTGQFFMYWACITIAIASLTREAPQATRSFFLVIPIAYFSAVGLYTSVLALLRIHTQKRIILGGVVLAFICYNLIYYFSSYYLRFPAYYAPAWRSEDKAVSLYIKEQGDRFEKVIFDKDAGFSYASLLFYTQLDPMRFQKDVYRLPDDSEGFSVVVSFDKYEIREIDWQKDAALPKALLITTEKRKPNDLSVLKRFDYPVRTVVAADGQKLYQFPVQDNAYVAISTD